jgi:ATP-dependent DNA helicase RecQ
VEKIKKLGHDSLSTYGAGKGRSRAEWLYFGRELISKGLLKVNYEHFNVVEATQQGLETVKTRSRITLRAPLASSALSGEKRKEQRKNLGAAEYDEEIFAKLRAWRAGVAKSKGLPAYMIFSDATLQALAAKRPSHVDDLKGVSGIGEKKLALYGEALMEVMSES